MKIRSGFVSNSSSSSFVLLGTDVDVHTVEEIFKGKKTNKVVYVIGCGDVYQNEGVECFEVIKKIWPTVKKAVEKFEWSLVETVFVAADERTDEIDTTKLPQGKFKLYSGSAGHFDPSDELGDDFGYLKEAVGDEIEEDSLTCPKCGCHGTVKNVPGKEHTYKCTSCDKQFTLED